MPALPLRKLPGDCKKRHKNIRTKKFAVFAVKKDIRTKEQNFRVIAPVRSRAKGSRLNKDIRTKEQKFRETFAVKLENMKLSEFNNHMPEELIAEHPAKHRDEARLMVLHRESGEIEHRLFKDIIDYFGKGDRFVLTFDHAKSFYVYNPDRSLTNGFEIAGADGKFVPAKIVNAHPSKGRGGKPVYNGMLDDAKIVVSADGVKEPKKLRYLYSAPWFGSIYNEVNLPLGAFHIGD